MTSKQNKNRIHIYAVIFGFILFFNSSTINSQNLLIDSIVLPPAAYSCSNTVVTVYTYLGCVNFTHVSNTDSVNGTSIGIKILHNTSLICYGAITYPVQTINLGLLPAGTYYLTVTGNYVGTTAPVTSASKTLVVLDCCPNASFTSSFSISDTTPCKNDSVFFTNTSTGSGITYKWFVDGVLSSTANSFSKKFTTVGIHSIQLIADSAGSCTRSKISEIKVIDVPDLDLGPDITFCSGATGILNAGLGWDSLMWSTSQTTKNITVSDSGNYSLIARDTSHCALHYDTIHVALKPAPIVDLGNDTTLCEGEKLVLSATNSGATYTWQDNSTSPAFQVTTAGQYWVRVVFSSNKCWTSDTINVEYKVCTGIDEVTNNQMQILYPNPFTNKLNIKSISGQYPSSIKILDVTGKVVAEKTNISEKTNIDVDFLEKGVYIIHIQMDGNQIIQKMIKE